MFAVDAEHEHCPVLQGREEMLLAFGKDHFKETQCCSTYIYLRPIDFLLPDGDLISEDGSIVLNHHCLFFNVSSSKQPQALCICQISSFSFSQQEMENKSISLTLTV